MAATITDSWQTLGRAALAAIALVAGFFVLALVSPAGLGLGDVKFAGVIGGFLGWFGWGYVAAGVLLGFALNAGVAMVVLGLRRGSRTSDVPFGPSMVAGAILAIPVAPLLIA